MAIDIFPLWHASLRHPVGNTPLSEGEPGIAMYRCVFCGTWAFFSSGRGSFLVLSNLDHAGSPPEHHDTLAVVCGTYSGGSQWQETTGRHSEHVELSRPMQTHVQVQKMSDGSCDI